MMILNETILDRLDKVVPGGIQHHYDIRYLEKWFRLYPEVFPKWMLQHKYLATFNWEKVRWEIYKT